MFKMNIWSSLAFAAPKTHKVIRKWQIRISSPAGKPPVPHRTDQDSITGGQAASGT
jgi:hypothetical protein